MKKTEQKSKKHDYSALGVVALVGFAVAVVIAVIGLSRTLTAFEDNAISKTPTAILASAGVSEGEVVSLPVMYYDQKMDDCVNLYDLSLRNALHDRQFEWSECGYHKKEIEQGILEFDLGEEYEPVAVGGWLTSNRGVKGDNFKRWFSAVEGKSASFMGVINLDYEAEGAKFTFYKKEFYPLDRAEFSAGDAVNSDGHNHLFTMGFAVPFMVLTSGEENFTVKADDDTWVYVNNQLVIDMGGIHDATVGKFSIHENGEIYTSVDGEDFAYSGVTVTKGESQLVRIFHADRDATESTFNLEFVGMNLTVTDAQMAKSGKDEGVQIAFDPTDPSYEAPLGESSVFQPDNSKGLIIMATVLGVLVVLFTIFIMIAIRVVVRRKADK